MEKIIFRFLSVPGIIVITSLFVSAIYHLTIKKEKIKVIKTKEEIVERIEIDKEWFTPLFNNAGFAIGFFMTFIGFGELILSDEQTFVGLLLGVMGLCFIWVTSFIRLTEDFVEYQPLLPKLLGLNLGKKKISYNEIGKITKVVTNSPFVNLKIITKNNRKNLLFTSFYNSEIGNVIYDLLKEKIK